MILPDTIKDSLICLKDEIDNLIELINMEDEDTERRGRMTYLITHYLGMVLALENDMFVQPISDFFPPDEIEGILKMYSEVTEHVMEVKSKENALMEKILSKKVNTLVEELWKI